MGGDVEVGLEGVPEVIRVEVMNMFMAAHLHPSLEQLKWTLSVPWWSGSSPVACHYVAQWVDPITEQCFFAWADIL